ncbi:hypothetical protein N0V88_007279 [Collariella sp. IMI 366227]|nr:hypothetical protein N0V88_007279 [Collariella sp. IMI 366227]
MQSAGLRHRQREEARKNAPPPPSPKISAPKIPNKSLPRSFTTGYAPPNFTINLSHPPSHRYNHVARALVPAIATLDFNALIAEALAVILPPSASPKATSRITTVIRFFSRLFLHKVHSAEETAEITGIACATGVPRDMLVLFNVVLDLLMACTSGGVRLASNSDSHQQTSRMVHFRTLDWDMNMLRQLVVEYEFVQYDGGPVVARSKDVKEIVDELRRSRSTTAYLVFCTPSTVYSVEKGYREASVQSSDEFLTTCNHDVADEPDPERIHAAAQSMGPTGMAGIIDESFERKEAVKEVWEKRLRARKRKSGKSGHKADGVGLDDVLHMLGHEWITHWGTHYAVVMDPAHGNILWRKVYQTDDLRNEEAGEFELLPAIRPPSPLGEVA